MDGDAESVVPSVAALQDEGSAVVVSTVVVNPAPSSTSPRIDSG